MTKILKSKSEDSVEVPQPAKWGAFSCGICGDLTKPCQHFIHNHAKLADCSPNCPLWEPATPPTPQPADYDAFASAWLAYDTKGLCAGWEKVAFTCGFGAGWKARVRAGVPVEPQPSPGVIHSDIFQALMSLTALVERNVDPFDVLREAKFVVQEVLAGRMSFDTITPYPDENEESRVAGVEQPTPKEAKS